MCELYRFVFTNSTVITQHLNEYVHFTMILPTHIFDKMPFDNVYFIIQVYRKTCYDSISTNL